MDGPEGLLVPLLSPFPHQLAELLFDRECCSHREPHQPYQQMVVYWFHQRNRKINCGPVDPWREPCNIGTIYSQPLRLQVLLRGTGHGLAVVLFSVLHVASQSSLLQTASLLGITMNLGEVASTKMFRIYVSYLIPWILSNNSNVPVWTSQTQYQEQILAPSFTPALSMQWEHCCSAPPMASFSVARTIWKAKGCYCFSRCC